MAATELSFYDRISDALAKPEGQLAIAAGARAKYDNRARAMSEFPNMEFTSCLLYTSPSPRDGLLSRMPSSA